MDDLLESEYKEFTIRRFRPGDETAFNEFHKSMFKKPTTPAFWKWKYLDNPAGENSIYIAEKDGEIVGQIGALPVYSLVEGRRVLASQTLDIAVREEYRNSGLFYKLEASSTNDLKEKGVIFTYGIAIRITLILSSRKLGFSKVGNISNMVKVLDARPYLAKRMPASIAAVLALPLTWFLSLKDRILLKENNIEMRELSELNDDITEIFRKHPPAKICVERSAAYLTWRYLDCPVKKYKFLAAFEDDAIKGYAVVGVAERSGLYGTMEEFFVADNDERIARTLLLSATKYFRSLGAVGITGYWMPEHHPLYSFMMASGFISRPVENYLIARSYSDDVKIEDLVVGSNWYYSLGDSDYFLF